MNETEHLGIVALFFSPDNIEYDIVRAFIEFLNQRAECFEIALISSVFLSVRGRAFSEALNFLDSVLYFMNESSAKLFAVGEIICRRADADGVFIRVVSCGSVRVIVDEDSNVAQFRVSVEKHRSVKDFRQWEAG